MSSDVLIDLGPDALSPLSSASEDTDAVDTETARVYFGPLKPSEQKYAAVGAQPTPLRRSARLSSMATPHVGAGDSDAGTSNAPSRDESVSRVGTPIEDVLPSDEPSIILASKILRAHDNPSPPPSPPPEVHVSPRLDALFDVSEAFTSEAVPSTTETPIDSAQMTADVDITQPDLITFDSPSTPSRSVHIAQLGPTERLDAPPPSLLATGATVDDLLSISPQPPPPAPFMPQAISQSVSGETTDSVDSETQVLEALSGEESAPAEQELLVEVERNADPRTPLRRSTRRRRTSSPARPKLVSVQNDSTLPYASMSTDDDDVAPQLFAPTTPLRFKKKNRKSSRSPSRDIMGDSISYDTENAQPNSTQYITEAQGVQETHAPETERELRSLSPTSNDVLMQVLFGASEPTEQPPQELLPSSEPASESNAAVPGPALTDSQAAQPIVPASNIQRTPQPILSTPTRALDVSRTPARRVPIAQAIVQGTFSLQKQSSSAASGQTKPSGVGIGTLGSPVFKRSALDDPTRTPAKRVPLKEALAAASTQPQDKGKAPVRHASPALDLSRETTRSGSAEPRPSRRAEKAAAEPTRPFVSALAAARSSKPSLDTASKSRSTLTKSYLDKDEPLKALPFPVVPSRRTPGSTSEADTVRSKLKPSPPEPIVVSSPPFSPAKAGSILKQPSAGASSRIPRIGTKPYTRPTPVGPPAAEKKPPLVARRAVGKPPTSATSNSGRLLRVVSVDSDPSSDDNASKTGPATATKLKGHATTPSTENRSVTALKRKLDGETSRASPPGARPVVVIRRVMPGMFSKQPAKTTSTESAPPPPSAAPVRPEEQKDLGLQKPRGPIKMRKVSDWKKPPQRESTPVRDEAEESKAPVAQEPSSSDHPTSRETTPPPTSSDVRAKPSSSDVKAGPSSSDVRSGPSSSSGARAERASRKQSVTPLGNESQASSIRRSTRPRRPILNLNAEIFGGARPQYTRSQRPVLTCNGAFAGMTESQLSALTSTNTEKNQQYFVDIQTEVIRKEGKRPASPTTKVRTSLEHQKAMKAQESQEREDRDQRMSAAKGEAEEDGSSLDKPDSPAHPNLDADGAPLKHHRAPGDEEDYETPPRPERPSKRVKLDGESREEKKVKWNRGLATIVYFDDQQLPQPKRPQQTETVQRGCLANTAKTLRLDTMGNIVADTPLDDLVRENISIKKFVYEDDPDPEAPEDSPASSTRSTKSVKSKSKKTKS